MVLAKVKLLHLKEIKMKKQLLLITILASAISSAHAADSLLQTLTSASSGALVGGALGALTYLTSIRPGYYAFSSKEFKSATLAGAAIGATSGSILINTNLSSKTEMQLSVLTALTIIVKAVQTNQPKELVKEPTFILNPDFPASKFLIAQRI